MYFGEGRIADNQVCSKVWWRRKDDEEGSLGSEMLDMLESTGINDVQDPRSKIQGLSNHRVACEGRRRKQRE